MYLQTDFFCFFFRNDLRFELWGYGGRQYNRGHRLGTAQRQRSSRAPGLPARENCCQPDPHRSQLENWTAEAYCPQEVILITQTPYSISKTYNDIYILESRENWFERMLSSYLLVLSCSTKDDQGVYKCRVRDHSGNQQTKSEFVRILDEEESYLRIYYMGFQTIDRCVVGCKQFSRFSRLILKFVFGTMETSRRGR